MGQGLGPVEVVGGEDHRGAGGDRLAQQAVEQVPTSRIEPGVRLVEQPELRPARRHHGQRRAAALAGRQAVDGHVGQSPGHAEALHGEGDLGVGGADRAAPEANVLGHGQVLVEPVAMAQHTDFGAHVTPVGPQVTAEDHGLTRRHGHQAGQHPEQGGLAGTVAPAHQHDLTALDVQAGAGQRREPPEQCHRASKVNDRLHETNSPYLRRSG